MCQGVYIRLLNLIGNRNVDDASNGSKNMMGRMIHGSALSLDCGDGSVLFLPAMHGQWFELAQHAQKLVRYVSCAYNFLSGRWSIWSAVRFRAVVNIWTRKV